MSMRHRWAMYAVALTLGATRIPAAGTSYVWKESPYPAPPYDSWTNAAQDIQTAVNHAAANLGSYDNVLVTNGTYDLTSALTVSAAVTVSSVGGAASTILQRSSGTIVTIGAAGAVVEGFTIRNGTASGVSMTAGTLRACIISNNSARWRGGVDANGPVLVQDCIIENNRASSGGTGDTGGIGIRNASALVERCIIRNNTGGGSGAGSGGSISAGVIRNCLIYDNAGGSGAGLNVTGGSVLHCTITRNSATGVGGGIRQTGGAVANCVVYGNVAVPGNPAVDNHSRTGGTFQNSCTTPLVSGGSSTGNIAVDPAFHDAGLNDWHLLPGSPCADAGMVVAAVTNDLDGASRPLNANGGDTLPDMGAYELPAGSEGNLRCGFAAMPAEGFDTLTTTLSATVHGSDVGGITCYWDTDGDGDTDALGTTLQTTANYAPGLYSVRLAVTNAAGQGATLVRKDCVRVAPSVVYVSRSGSNSYPYGTWETATSNLLEAVEIALANDAGATTVRVAADELLVTNSVNLTKGIVISGMNRDQSIVRRASLSATAQRHRVLLMSHVDCVVEALTVTNGNVSVTVGGGVYMRAGTLRNCNISRNLSDNGSAGGVYVSGGVVSNCLIIANRARGDGGARVDGGLLTDCIITANATGVGGIANEAGGLGVVSGSARNVLVHGHSHANTAAGMKVSGGSVANCTVAGNASSSSNVGAGMVIAAGSAVNMIVAGNTRSGSPDNVRASDISRYTYSCAPELVSGTGNVTASPVFVPGSYRPDLSSPTVNKGLYQAWMAGAVDLAGQPRVKDVVDMGAYEHQPAMGTLMLLR